MNPRPSIFLLLITLLACDSGNRIEQTKALKNEIKASQIKRVTNTQLIYSANEWGKKIALIAEKSLSSQLNKSPGQASDLCKNLDSIPVIAALKKEYGIEIDLLNAVDTENKKLHAKEREILSAYLYSARNNAATGDNLQQIEDSLFVYNAPISPGNLIYDQCAPKSEVPFAVWRVLFSKKEIIRKLDAKKLKK